jgi:ketosteroid isomerase-like protein
MTQDETHVLEKFNQAFNRHDVDAMMALMTEDCVFDNTYPPPDGRRFEGAAQVRKFWEEFFQASPQAHLEFEELFVSGERGFQRWIYTWGGGHVRGVDIFRFEGGDVAGGRVAGGKIAEKLSYVKG